ncbi:YifB family Mg chelatase-like AAA ATPase [Leeia sp. TBRC 13508]|uniref:YifB family Mg chelatase-like AAA ATPase n=1 Tax=Leeia speluncae TaxID=2884804 RepID=A0ABS8D343_9NEIS|nr:YifB family Mg chelatase-like AAA ATPase [Leeia speluncae]MCB6182618.1 YifB family Mg chelatase-like AAA ATPase [Leeia speluncae]
MSLAVLYSRALNGLSAPLVTVEVHLANGLPSFALVGLPEAEVKESRDRVRAAIQTAGFELPQRKITINLAPADLPKASGRFDLAMAIGILVASGQLKVKQLENYEFAGELALTGALRPIRGALAMSLATKEAGRQLILPIDNAIEAALVQDASVLPARDLLAVCAHLAELEKLLPHPHHAEMTNIQYPDLSDIKGQTQAKRALEIAAAGQHSLLLMGPPGTGKSMLAQRLPGLLPPMNDHEALEAAMVQSLGSGGWKSETWKRRPYRGPHHTASGVALVGGGSDPRPGEISLAHHGVLFLDELPEFDRKVLEVLREPLEAGHITISRAARQADFPARFQLIAAMNPCPCGYHGHPTARCRCSPDQVQRYKGKLSGPFLDRIDLMMEVPSVPPEQLAAMPQGETSESVRERVIRAFEKQHQRQGKPNSRLIAPEIEKHCQPDDAGQQLLTNATRSLNLSARAYHRILRVARTIADLSDEPAINVLHVGEAIQYRRGV